MTRFVSLIIALGLVLPSAGCSVRTGPGYKSNSSASTGGCHPSQYWDGHKCKHKGKGKGARKHDGR